MAGVKGTVMEMVSGNRSQLKFCENEDGNFQQAVIHAQWLIQKLLREHHIPLINVVKHQHRSGKTCPRLLLTTWDHFSQHCSK